MTKSMASRMVLVLAVTSAWAGAAYAQDPPQDAEMAPPVDDMAPPPEETAPPPVETTPPPPDPEPPPPTYYTTPPPAEPAPPPPERRRRRHREESSGRDFDLLWFGPEVGLAMVDLKMVSYDQLLPEQIDVRENGVGFGAAAGVRLKILSVGLHLAVGQFTSFDVWAINLDGQLRIPLGFLEPYIRLGLGYAFLGAFDTDVEMQDVTVNGWDLQAGFGLDLYPADFFSLGAGADFTILNLSRTESITAVDLTQDGAAVGVAVWLQVKAALHF